MSKKTKQEKIIAGLRRQLVATNQKTSPGQAEYSVRNDIANQSKIPTVQISNIMPTSDNFLELIKKDLTKTLILSILAISFELVLYFILRTGSI